MTSFLSQKVIDERTVVLIRYRSGLIRSENGMAKMLKPFWGASIKDWFFIGGAGGTAGATLGTAAFFAGPIGWAGGIIAAGVGLCSAIAASSSVASNRASRQRSISLEATREGHWDKPGFPIMTKLVEGVAVSEFDILDRQLDKISLVEKGKKKKKPLIDDEPEDPEKTKDPYEGWTKLVGCFIYPFIVGEGKMKEYKDQRGRVRYSLGKSDISPTYEDEKGEMRRDESKWENRKVRINEANHSHHYLEKHTYLELTCFGDSLAKYYGINKLKGSNDYGFTLSVWFTHYVGWRMNVVVDDKLEDIIHYDCILKEDVDEENNLDRVAKLALQLATTTAVAGLASASATNAQASLSVPQLKSYHEAKAIDEGKKLDQNLGSALATAKSPQKRMELIQKARYGKRVLRPLAIEAGRERDKVEYDRDIDRWESAKDKIKRLSERGQRFTARSVGRAFAGATRLFSGGSASFSGGIAEFLKNKANYPLLKFFVKTGKHYDEKWKRKLNWHIWNWFFPFGDDEEICMKEGFGYQVGYGYDVLKNLHGWIQLADNILFLETTSNPLIEYWVTNPIFVYQKCCREANKENNWTHSAGCERPRLTKDNFYEGYTSQITHGLLNVREQRHTHDFVISKTKKTVEEIKTDKTTFVYCYLWCGDESHNWIFRTKDDFRVWKPLESFSYKKDADPKKQLFVGMPECCEYLPKDPSWTEESIAPWKDRPYTTVSLPKKENINNKTEYVFGFGHGYDNLVARYLKGRENEEIIFTKTHGYKSSWVIKGDNNGKLHVVERTEKEDIIKETYEYYTGPLKVSAEVMFNDLSGTEGFGINPPDSFGNSRDDGGNQFNFNFGDASFGGIIMPDIDALKVDTKMPEGLTRVLNRLDLAEVNFGKTKFASNFSKNIVTSTSKETTIESDRTIFDQQNLHGTKKKKDIIKE